MSRLIFIGGTDTHVGKTMTCCALIQHFSQKKKSVKYLKPFQTGPRTDWDGERVKAHHALTPLAYFWTHEHAGAPYECTRFFNATPIAWDSLLAWTQKEGCRATQDIVLIEGCGGLQVPITPQHTLLDWARAFPTIEIILVSHLRLGTLNHTAQSIQTLRSLSNPFLGIIYSGEGNTRNISMIETLHHAPTLGRVSLKNEYPWFEGSL